MAPQRLLTVQHFGTYNTLALAHNRTILVRRGILFLTALGLWIGFGVYAATTPKADQTQDTFLGLGIAAVAVTIAFFLYWIFDSTAQTFSEGREKAFYDIQKSLPANTYTNTKKILNATFNKINTYSASEIINENGPESHSERYKR